MQIPSIQKKNNLILLKIRVSDRVYNFLLRQHRVVSPGSVVVSASSALVCLHGGFVKQAFLQTAHSGGQLQLPNNKPGAWGTDKGTSGVSERWVNAKEVRMGGQLPAHTLDTDMLYAVLVQAEPSQRTNIHYFH